MTAQPPPWGSYGAQQPQSYPQQPPPYGGPYGPPWPAQQGQQPYPRREVTRERKRTSHGLHLFLTIVTFGMWGLLVWLPLSLWHRFGPKRKTVTRWE